MKNKGNPQFEMIQKNDGFENRSPPPKKKKLKNCIFPKMHNCQYWM